jgi:hypothetical protein
MVSVTGGIGVGIAGIVFLRTGPFRGGGRELALGGCCALARRLICLLVFSSSKWKTPGCQVSSDNVRNSFEIFHLFLGRKRKVKPSLRLSDLAKFPKAQSL